MTIKEILQQADHPDRLAVEVLLARTMGVGREQLFARPEQVVQEGLVTRFATDFGRLQRGEPLAYICGEKEFYGLSLVVNSSVLIPRPETEMLVDKVIDLVGDQAFRILDVGTGSGAIAIAVAHSLARARVVATDVSAEALEVARANVERHGLAERVDLIESDLLSQIEGPFDVVVANLPYIGEERFRFVSKETEDFEPHVALFGGDDGLRLYEALFSQLKNGSWRPRMLMGEFGFAQAEEMKKLLDKFFEHEDWRIDKDYASIDRIFMVSFAST